MNSRKEQEVIKRNAELKKQLAANARKLKIEAALEKVRTVALKMKEPADMLNVCKSISLQLQSLGVKEIRNVQTAIFYESRGTYMNYEYYAKHKKIFITETVYTNHKVAKTFASQMLKGKGEVFITHIKGKKVKDWIAYQKTTNVFIDRYLEKASSLNYYWHSLGPVALGISTYVPLHEDELNLFKRFLKVFELAYKRYMDIEQAMAQAREAQIEASLERVRAVAMSMRKPEELAAVGRIIFTELKKLGFADIRNTEIIVNKDTKNTITSYYYSDYGVTGTIDVDTTTHPTVKQWMEELKKTSDSFAAVHISEKEMKEWRKYRESLGYLPDLRLNKVKRVEYYSYSIGLGALSVSSFKPINDEQLKTLERFKNVFGLAYRRYADVAKAEAQAREAQIEVALERVRARVMAMNSSDELNETSLVFGEQLRKLGIDWQFSYFWLIEEDKDDNTFWITWPDNQTSTTTYSLAEADQSFKECIIAWRNQVKIHDTHVPVEYVQEWLDTFERITADAGGVALEIMKPDNFKEGVYYYDAMIKFGSFGILTNRVINEEEKNIQCRFAVEFERAYTRFLDLQKAEAQAKESQIQLAMERVRARTMAMQKSDELAEAASLLFTQIADLGTNSWSSGFIIFQPDELSINSWMSKPDGSMGVPFNIPVTEDPFFIKIYEAYKKGEEFFVMESSGKELEETYKYMFSLPGAAKALGAIEDLGFQMPTFQITHCVFFPTGFLMFITYEPCQEMWEIFKRFGKVFEQTYTRFLDLQKAEAQARESKIQLALERVRARTMAMQKSEELSEAVYILFQQFRELGENPDQATIGIINEREQVIEYWVTMYGNQMNKVFKFSIDEPHVTNKIYNAWKANEKSLVIDLRGKALSEFMAYRAGKGGAAINPNEKRRIINVAFFSRGLLNVQSKEVRSAESIQLLERFSKVFDQTYTRFLDLQKAEAQAREAQIEAGLERVRSRSLAMHKTSELQEVIHTVHKELLNLNIAIHGGSFIAINNDIETELRCWGSGGTADTSDEVHLPLYEKPFCTNLIKGIKNGPGFFTEEYTQQEKREFFTFLFNYEPWSKLDAKQKDETLSSPGGYTRSCCVSQHTSIFIINHYGEQFSATDNDILKRFGKVFEQAYTRFLDLQKAESQAREAQIELGLERVRARAMAMQKSDELKELIGTVFIELTKLDLVLTRCLIMIYDPESNASTWWMANSEAPTDPIGLYVKYHEQPPYLAYLQAWQERKYKWQYILEGKTKVEWDDFIFIETELSQLPDFVIAGMKAPDRVYLNSSFNSFGNLTLATLEPLSDEHFDILLRFAKVFDLTYTRFNDLQKAEAQARESQIQLALERVRARTMAMQHSDELKEAAALLFQQAKALGVPAYSCGYNIWEKNEKTFTSWMSSQDGSDFNAVLNIPLTEDANFIRFAESRERGEQFFVLELRGERMQEHYQYLKTIPAFKAYFDYAVSVGFDLPETQIHYLANFSHGNLLFITLEPCPEFHDVFKRFAAVFEQTYTRFLDLQKAEAQAREARIEAALEKVRSRTMAMQKSEELPETSLLLFQQVKELGMTTVQNSIGIVNEEAGFVELSTTVHGHNLPHTLNVPIDDPYVMAKAVAAWKAKQKSLKVVFEGQELKNYNEHRNSFFETKVNFPEDQWIVNIVFFSKGWLSFSSNKNISVETFELLKRFTAVFEQTYIRFNDLKQAEAQAREAQIEAGLERVRSRTLAMHKSDELAETAAVVFNQLINLGIAPNRLYIIIIKEETGDMEAWVTDEDGSKVSKGFTGNANGNESLKKMYDGWKGKRKSLTIDMQGKELENYFHYLSNELKVPFKGGLAQKRRVQNIAYFGKGLIGIASPDDQPQETIQLLERFAAVFNLTYTRFNDLQIAEAQTHKANIETALERVRARALAMQQPEELIEVAQVMRYEMGLLGVEELETSSIYIHEENSHKAECWYAIKDIRHHDKKLVADHFILNLKDTWVGRQMFEFYNSPEKQISIPMQGANRKEWIDYCSKQSKLLEGFYGENIPDRTYHLYKFSNGTIGAATPGDISTESWELLQRAASVFSLAYSRFKDLTQARIDLQRLKEEKQRAESALTELRATQTQLIQSEKMASLGELTAGIAHEIQNPLNFVNNFSEVSNELLDEMNAEIEKGDIEEAKAIVNDIKQNLEKINHHGKRADAIVKGMLQHSRSSSGQKEPTDINALADEYLRLSFHGLRAKDKSFNAKFETDFDPSIGKINVMPQDMGRVILNLINNAFYAVTERKKQNEPGYDPTLIITTKKLNDKIEIRVKDNGNGIPQKILDKIFQPFFTTKPTGQGTGLGLSLSYDIIKAHGGEIKVETKEKDGTEFIVILPS